MPHSIITLLADGKTHSGVELGKSLGITRAAVGKQITKLKEMGFQITCIKGVGYQLLIPFERLDAAQINMDLNELALSFVPSVEVVWSLASTNDYLMSKIKMGHITSSGFACLAEHQSSGRGRRGKAWISPLGAGLYWSLAWRFEQGAESLEGLSLSVALAIVEVLERECLIKKPKIKWPNDIFLNDKKLGGILIDVMGEAGGPCWAVIGVGLNIYSAELAMQHVDQPWIGLSANAGTEISRNRLAVSLIASVIKKVRAHERDGFQISAREWSKYDAFLGENVVVKMGDNNFFSGVSQGISKTGGLVVEGQGVRKVIKSGEVSLRRA